MNTRKEDSKQITNISTKIFFVENSKGKANYSFQIGMIIKIFKN